MQKCIVGKDVSVKERHFSDNLVYTVVRILRTNDRFKIHPFAYIQTHVVQVIVRSIFQFFQFLFER